MTEDPPPLDRLAVESIARSFGAFADEAVARLPLYRRLCTAAADDLDVCARLGLARPDQRLPNLLLAAVHDVLLAGADDPLADWYPSIPSQNSVARSRPVGNGDDDPWPHFRRLALEDPDVERLLRTQSTQTNEIGRSAALFPALYQAAFAASSAPPATLRPIGIVEIGSSAGLNLHQGAYGYRYRMPRHGPEPERVITAVGHSSRLMLDCEIRGDRMPPLPDGALTVTGSIGIDERPLDVLAAGDARWLQACQWPEETARLSRLRAAIALSHDDPPHVVEGDAVDDLRAHVEAVPAHALPVVVSTWVLAYLSPERQGELMDLMASIGADRDVAMVLSEQPERVTGIPIPPRPDGDPDGRATALVRMEWRDGEQTSVRLADQHPHGTWLEWLGP